MTLSNAKTTESDRSLGIRPPISGLPLALVGQCSAGTINTPTVCTDPDQVKALFGRGRIVQRACYAIENQGLVVVMVKTATGTAAVFSAVDSTGKTGTSVVTTDAAVVPFDDYSVIVKVISGGTIGVTGITIQYSLDGGLSYFPVTPLGVAVTYTISEGNVKVNFAAGTLIANDVVSFTTTAPEATDGELTTALTALKNTALAFGLVDVAVQMTTTSAAVCATWLTSMHAVGKHKDLMGAFRVQGAAESDATYTTAFNTAFSAFSSSSMYIAAGACDVQSSVDRGCRFKRPPSFPVAPMMASKSEEIDVSALAYPLPGVTILDAKGNPKTGYYNEAVSPGLDDMRALTLRTWDGETGVFVNQPRLISAAGSDFDFSPKRRVMNLARQTAVTWLRRSVISIPLRANKTTGNLREATLQALEADINSRLEREIMGKPKASNVRVVLSRSDAVLLPPYPLTGKIRMQPLAYVKDATLDAGWELAEEISIVGVQAS